MLGLNIRIALFRMRLSWSFVPKLRLQARFIICSFHMCVNVILPLRVSFCMMKTPYCQNDIGIIVLIIVKYPEVRRERKFLRKLLMEFYQLSIEILIDYIRTGASVI